MSHDPRRPSVRSRTAHKLRWQHLQLYPVHAGNHWPYAGDYSKNNLHGGRFIKRLQALSKAE